MTVSLTREEKDKFVMWLAELADTNQKLAEQSEKLGVLIVARKLQTEAAAAQIIKEILNAWANRQ